MARPVPPDARVRRLKLRVAAWGVWTILITTLPFSSEEGCEGKRGSRRPRKSRRLDEPGLGDDVGAERDQDDGDGVVAGPVDGADDGGS